LGIKSKILATEGIDSTVQFFGIAGDAAEGVVITTNLNRDDKRAVVQNFIKNYKARYGLAPDMVGASSYDALYILANAIQIGGTKSEAIRDALAKTKDFDGATGIIKGYIKGEILKPVQVQIVKGGEFRYFGEITDPEIITPPR
jgi:branched-chain amino acid transport system substrate-binding protein